MQKNICFCLTKKVPAKIKIDRNTPLAELRETYSAYGWFFFQVKEMFSEKASPV